MAKQTNNIASISSVALLQHEALHILSQLEKKPIVAIDLDYTVSKYRRLILEIFLVLISIFLLMPMILMNY